MNTSIQYYARCGKNNIRSCILILILGSIVYGNHLQNPFQFDTVVYIVNNHTLDNVSKILDINFFKSNIFTNRGLLQISFALNAYLDGFRTFSYHLVNLILHLTNAILIYFITCRIWFILVRGVVCYKKMTYTPSLFYGDIIFTAPDTDGISCLYNG